MGCMTSSDQHELLNSTMDPMSENLSIYELTHYTNITKEELDNMRRIEAFKNARLYENLVFEGGGVKGIAYCGAIETLSTLGILQKIKRYAGSSAGAIIATLLAIGYTSNELLQIISNTDFGEFMKQDFGYLGDAINLFRNLGCTSGKSFEQFMSGYIQRKTGNNKYTFKDLYDNQDKELVITVTNLNRSIPMYISHHSHPDMPIKEAVRMSMRVPILFFPHKYNKDYYVDGGLLDNYPLHVFDGEYPGDPQAVLNKVEPNPRTLGLKLILNNEEEDLEVYKRVDIATEKEFLSQLISTLYVQSERKNMVPSFWKRTVSLHVDNIPITQFSLSDKEKENLYLQGIQGVLDFFNNDGNYSKENDSD